MNRFAHHYVHAAMSGTALIAASVIAFVVVLSFQAVRDWPGLGIAIGTGEDQGRSAPPADAGQPARGGAPQDRAARSANHRVARFRGGSAPALTRGAGHKGAPAAANSGGGPGGVGVGRDLQPGVSPAPAATPSVPVSEAHQEAVPTAQSAPSSGPGSTRSVDGNAANPGKGADQSGHGRGPAAPGSRADSHGSAAQAPGHTRGTAAAGAGRADRSVAAPDRSESSSRSRGSSSRSARGHGHGGGPPSSAAQGPQARGQSPVAGPDPPAAAQGPQGPPPWAGGPGRSGDAPGHGRTH